MITDLSFQHISATIFHHLIKIIYISPEKVNLHNEMSYYLKGGFSCYFLLMFGRSTNFEEALQVNSRYAGTKNFLLLVSCNERCIPRIFTNGFY